MEIGSTIFATAMLLGACAMAHEGSAHDGTGPNGGRLADTAKYHLELVVKADTIDVFVSDKASRPIPATGLSGIAVVVAGGTSTRVPLIGETAKLSGKATTKLPDGTRSVVQVKLPDGQTIQASFD